MQFRTHSLIVYVLFLFVCIAYLTMAVKFPLAYIWATYEDLLGEWTQFYFFLTALVLSCCHAIKTNKFRLFFSTLSLACFYVVMEEISWGQRLFGWGSSEFFRTHNLQGETNLHNMLTGPYSTFLKDLLTYLLTFGLFIYGCIYPIVLKYQWKWAVWIEKTGIPAPPGYLSPLFAIAAILEAGIFSFNEAEIAEVLVGMALAFFTLHYLFSTQQHIDYHESHWTPINFRHLAYKILQTTVLVLLLAATTTFSLYATDAGKNRSDSRIFSGVKKFAARYERYEQWDTVIELTEIILAKRPDNQRYLRKMWKAYDRKGNKIQAQLYLTKAINVDLKRIEEFPKKTSSYRSLVRSYRLSGNKQMANKYLAKALELGLNRLNLYPRSTNAMYSLGKTYELMKKKRAAKELFSKAYQLKPKSKKFRKAYYKYK